MSDQATVHQNPPQGIPDEITQRARRRRRWAGIVLLLAALLLYLATLDNGLQPEELRGGDLITHQYAQVQARPSNAPGYPLYTMGGWLWFHGLRSLARLIHPLPNPIPLLSSYSTLWALLALWLLYRIICHATRSPRRPAGFWPLAWLISAFYAVTYFFWYYATTTEQYTSAIAQTLAIVYVYQLWSGAEQAARAEKPGAIPPLRSRPMLLLLLLAFLSGLSLAHMLTIAFIVPPLVLVVLWQAPYLLRSLRTIMAAVAAAALPLASYVYVYARGAAHPEWWGAGSWTNANQWFWSFVSTAQGREELGWGLEAGRAFFGNGFPELMWRELSIPFFVIGILGILLLNRRLVTLLYGFIGLTLLFSWAYRYGNWYQVILPVYPLILLGVAAVVDRLDRPRMERIGRISTDKTNKVRVDPLHPLNPLNPRSILLLALIVVAIAWRVNASLPEADSRDRPDDTALDHAAILLDQPLPTPANLFAVVDDALALQYLTEIWEIQPQAAVVSSQEAGERLAAGAPVLSTWQAASTLADELPPVLAPTIQSHSPDWLIFAPPGQPTRSPQVVVDEPVTDGVTLHGYTVTSSPTGAPVYDGPPGLDVTLFWTLENGTWPDELAISVRPTLGGAFIPSPDNPAAILQQDAPAPARGMVAAPAGSPARVADAYRFTGGEFADGVMIIVYRPVDGGFENVAEMRFGF